MPTGSEESVIMTSKASWFCFMNSKPSPTWRVSFGLKNPLAIPGRNFFDTLMTSYTANNIKNWWAGIPLLQYKEQTVISIALWREARILAIPTSSISQRTTDSTSGFFTTSLSTPPSPPPIISTCKNENMLMVNTENMTHLKCSHRAVLGNLNDTFLGEGWLHSGRLAIISW